MVKDESVIKCFVTTINFERFFFEFQERICFAYEFARVESTVWILHDILTELMSQFGVFVVSNS